MIIMENMTVIEVLSYIHMLVRISEQHGGVRTTYAYDLMHRAEMAKILESEETLPETAWTKINTDILCLARD